MPYNNKYRLRRRLGLHLLCWAVFITYEVSLVKLIRMEQGIAEQVWADYVIPYAINIGLFYFHARVVMTLCFDRSRKIALLLLLLLAELAVYLLAMGIKDFELTGHENFLAALYPSKLPFLRQLWRGVYFLIFSTAFWWIEKSFAKEQQLKRAETQVLQEEKQKKELQLQLVQSQNAFLRAQINPHLLFNTLNFIHSEVQETAPEASEAIITLSDMMRYSLTDTKADGKVRLEQEVEQIENLVQINQFRFDHQLCIHIRTKGDFRSASIPPLLLLPFVENLFKYAVLTEKEHPATIAIELEENTLHFKTMNRKRLGRMFPSSGIGIQNVKTRLENSYPGNFDLSIEEDESFYRVHLRIET